MPQARPSSARSRWWGSPVSSASRCRSRVMNTPMGVMLVPERAVLRPRAEAVAPEVLVAGAVHGGPEELVRPGRLAQQHRAAEEAEVPLVVEHLAHVHGGAPAEEIAHAAVVVRQRAGRRVEV